MEIFIFPLDYTGGTLILCVNIFYGSMGLPVWKSKSSSNTHKKKWKRIHVNFDFASLRYIYFKCLCDYRCVRCSHWSGANGKSKFGQHFSGKIFPWKLLKFYRKWKFTAWSCENSLIWRRPLAESKSSASLRSLLKVLSRIYGSFHGLSTWRRKLGLEVARNWWGFS